jgi:hypothetical protein
MIGANRYIAADRQVDLPRIITNTSPAPRIASGAK